MRIAFIANPQSPNGWYRGIGPMVALGRRGHEIRQVERIDGAFRADLVTGCDVVHIHRLFDERALGVIRRAKAAGIAVVWDNDDDIAAVPRNSASRRRIAGLQGERMVAAVKRIASSVDLVTTPSARIAEQLSSYGAECARVVENYVRDESLETRRAARRDGSVTVGWVAGLEHQADVERIPIREMLQRLLDAHEHVRVVSIGAGLGLNGSRYRHVRGVPFAALDREVATFDVGIAPIADISFNRARSNVKLKEYAVLGVPWLASPVGPYVGLGERQGGRLVADGEWYEALERLVEKGRDRRKLGKSAARWGRTQTISANVQEWEEHLAEAVSRAGPR